MYNQPPLLFPPRSLCTFLHAVEMPDTRKVPVITLSISAFFEQVLKCLAVIALPAPFTPNFISSSHDYRLSKIIKWHEVRLLDASSNLRQSGLCDSFSSAVWHAFRVFFVKSSVLPVNTQSSLAYYMRAGRVRDVICVTTSALLDWSITKKKVDEQKKNQGIAAAELASWLDSMVGKPVSSLLHRHGYLLSCHLLRFLLPSKLILLRRKTTESACEEQEW